MSTSHHRALYACIAFIVGASLLAGCRLQSETTGVVGPAPGETGYVEPAEEGADNIHRVSGSTVTNAVAYPTGDRRTSAILLEKTLPATILSGRAFPYEIRVENLTGLELTDVTVTDRVPASFEVVQSDPQSTSRTGAGVSWALGDLAPGEVRTIRVTGKAGQTGALISHATVSYSAPVSATVSVIAPELSIAVSPIPDVLQGETFPVRLTVRNSGVGAAPDTTVTYHPPEGLVAVDGRSVWELGTLEPGEAKSIGPVMVRADRKDAYTHRATVTAEFSNGEITATSGPVAMRVKRPELKIAIEKPEETPIVGRPGEYRITVTNAGDGEARNATARFPVPEGMKFFSASDAGSETGGVVTWSLGKLEAGASKTVNVKVVSGEIGLVRGTAVVEADHAEPSTHSQEFVAKGVPSVKVSLDRTKESIVVGDEETYRIRVRNDGSAAATGVRVVCKLDEKVKYVESRGPTKEKKRTDKEVSFELASLRPRDTIEWQVRVKAERTGAASFNTEVTYAESSKAIPNGVLTHVIQ